MISSNGHPPSIDYSIRINDIMNSGGRTMRSSNHFFSFSYSEQKTLSSCSQAWSHLHVKGRQIFDLFFRHLCFSVKGRERERKRENESLVLLLWFRSSYARTTTNEIYDEKLSSHSNWSKAIQLQWCRISLSLRISSYGCNIIPTACTFFSSSLSPEEWLNGDKARQRERDESEHLIVCLKFSIRYRQISSNNHKITHRHLLVNIKLS